ncbi:MAG: Transcription elongation factor GreA [Mycoplasmataceae bacterium]|nr:MAG: Transcription elongation factor GreA [Mycoplasmataceae bacterium]
MNKSMITEEGYQLIKVKLRDLEKNSKEIAERLSYARLDGDLSENADWIVLRENLESTHDKINRIRKVLENSDIVKGNTQINCQFIQIGNKVSYSIFDSSNIISDEISEIEITSEIDSDPFINKISYQSPLGSSLIGKSVGDILEIMSSKNLNKRSYKIKVLKIK